MRSIVVGAGAVGSLLGGLLSDAHEVHLLGRGPHIHAVRERGLSIEGVTERHVKLPATDDPRALPRDADLLVFTVKAHDTREAARSVRGIAPEGTPVLSLQNGIGNVEALASVFGPENVLAGVIAIAVTRGPPGTVVHVAPGVASIGRPEGEPDADVRRVADALSAALPVATSDNMRGEIFLKAIANAAINGLTAIHRVPNGDLLERPAMTEEMDALIAESVLVARAFNVRLPAKDVRGYVHDIVGRTAANRSSMLQDIEAGRPTEVGFINGALSRIGRSCGVPTPRNDGIVAEIRRIEAGYHH